MLYFLYTIHVTTCIFLILVVLLQRGKGADLSVFGGGSTQAAFGARGTATLLHKLTVGFFVAFMFTTIAIALFQNSLRSDSVLSGVADEAAVEQPIANGAVDGEASAPNAEPAASDATPAAVDGEAGSAEVMEASPANEGGEEPPASAEQ